MAHNHDFSEFNSRPRNQMPATGKPTLGCGIMNRKAGTNLQCAFTQSMKRRGFFKALAALAGCKAIGVKAASVESIPNPDWVNAEPASRIAYSAWDGSGPWKENGVPMRFKINPQTGLFEKLEFPHNAGETIHPDWKK